MCSVVDADTGSDTDDGDPGDADADAGDAGPIGPGLVVFRHFLANDLHVLSLLFVSPAYWRCRNFWSVCTYYRYRSFPPVCCPECRSFWAICTYYRYHSFPPASKIPFGLLAIAIATGDRYILPLPFDSLSFISTSVKNSIWVVCDCYCSWRGILTCTT